MAAYTTDAQTELGPADRWITLGRTSPRYTLGWEAIRWGMKYLRQPDGENAGERFRFTPSQMAFILNWYGLRKDGDRASWNYTHGVRRLPKGAGKSPFAAVMALIELCAPVRFARWGVDKDGNTYPVGKPVGMPLVQIAGVSQEQGLINTMRMVRALIVASKPDGTADHSIKSRLVSEYGLDVGKTQIQTPNGGQLHVITSSATAAEGALTTFGICDQTEAWVKMNGGHDLFQVMDRNAAKSKSRLVQTANAWQPGIDSVAEQTFDAWVAEQEGRTLGKARTLMDVRMAPPSAMTLVCPECTRPDCKHDKIIDRDALVRGVTEAYGDCWWADPEDIVDNHILDPKTPLDVSKRFYLNWPTVSEDAWIEPYEWSRWADLDFELPDGAAITLGFDGSRNNDATALIGCDVETGFTFEIGIWETLAKGKIRVPVPVSEVDAAVARAFERWSPVAFFADVREWESFSKVSWPEQYGSRLKLHAVPGGRDPQPIAWDMRYHVSDFTAACELVHVEITGDVEVFRHDGSSLLAKHVNHARRRPNKYGISIGKESAGSDKKIDAAVAMIIARHARRLYLAGQQRESAKHKPRTGRVTSYS